MSGKNKVTIKTLAHILGLTHSTVSKALRGSSDISLNTQKKVKKLAEEMGYRPNIIARSLAQRRSHTIGVIVPEILTTFYSYVVNAFYKAAKPLGYEVIIMVSNESFEYEQEHLHFLDAFQVDGILISISEETSDCTLLKQLNYESGLPIVFFDRALEGLNLTTVSNDNEQSTIMIMEHLVSLGHRKIGYLGPANFSLVGKQRYQGYKKALELHNLAVRDDFFVSCKINSEAAYQAMKRLLSAREKPDAILCMNDYIAQGAVQAALDTHLSIPDDIAIAGFGNCVETAALALPITTIEQHPAQIGEMALELIVKEIESRNRPLSPKKVWIDTELIIRASTVGNKKD